jgi:hypothetical protein
MHHLINLNDILRNGITGEELISAQSKAINNINKMQLNLGFIDSRTEILGEGLLYKNDPNYFLSRLKLQEKLKPKNIQAVAKKWLGKKGTRLLVIKAR